MRLRDRAKGKVVNVTVIDQCGAPPQGATSHFDIAQSAFDELFGPDGKAAGHGMHCLFSPTCLIAFPIIPFPIS